MAKQGGKAAASQCLIRIGCGVSCLKESNTAQVHSIARPEPQKTRVTSLCCKQVPTHNFSTRVFCSARVWPCCFTLCRPHLCDRLLSWLSV